MHMYHSMIIPWDFLIAFSLMFDRAASVTAVKSLGRQQQINS